MKHFNGQSLIFITLLFIPMLVQASFKNDTIQAGTDILKSHVFADSARYDSALFYVNRAAITYQKHKIWDRYLKCRGFIFLYKREKNENYDALGYVLESLNLSVKRLGEKHLITGDCYNYLANLYADKDNNDTAEFYFRKALAIFNFDVGHNKPFVAKSYLNIGMMLSDQNKTDSALLYFKKSLDLYEELYGKNHLSIAAVYNGIGVLYYYKGNFQKCLENFQKVTSIRQAVLGYNHPEVAKGYNNLGAVYEKLGKYQEALEVDNKALKIRLAVLNPDNRDISLSFNNIGNIYSALGQYELAIQYHLKALDRRLKKIDQLPGDVIMSYTNLGVCYMFMGIYDEALQYLRKAIKYNLEKFGENNVYTADSYNNIGDIFEGLGESDSALWNFNKALSIRLKIFPSNHPAFAGSYNNIGHMYFLKGDYEAALRYFTKALAVDSEIFGMENPSKASSYAKIGEVYSQMGEYSKALEYLNEALTSLKKQLGENHPNVANALNSMASIYKIQKNYEKAIALNTQASDILEKTYGKIHRDVASSYSDLAAIYTDIDDTTSALKYQNKAIDIYQQIYKGKYYGLAAAYNNLGDIQYQSGQYHKALISYQQALCANDLSFSSLDIMQNQDIEKALNKYELLQTLKRKSNALYALYKIERNVETLKLALSTIDLTIKLIDDVRLSYKLNESKLHFVEEASDIYILGADIAYSLYSMTKEACYLAKLFAISQESKSQVLSDAVEQSHAVHFSEIPDSIVAQEKEVRMLLDAAKIKLQLIKFNEKTDSLSLAKLEEKVFQFSMQYKQISELIELEYPHYNEILRNKDIPSIKEIQDKLSTSTVLLDYFVGDSALYIFTISKNYASVQQTRIDSSFNKSISQLLSGIGKNREDQMMVSSEMLYGKLIAPISKNLIEKKRLLIIPDKKLLYLPFEVLIKPSVKEMKVNSPDYLIRHFDVLYNYSVTLAFKQRDGRRSSLSSNSKVADFVGFAPVFDNPANKARLYTPNDSLSKLYAALRSVTVGGKNYRPLVHTKEEIINIVNLFNNYGLKGVGFLYDNATESNFRKEISKYRFIHIATHGLSNDEFPELSGFVFMPEKISGTTSKDIADNNGMLFASDIFHLDLNAELVVLSSCESGTGKLVRGEGLMSLTRGFVYAGVPQIVYSLWKVDDRSTCELMTKFYEGLLQKKPTEQALREAKLKLLDNPATSSPRFWAAFTLLGK